MVSQRRKWHGLARRNRREQQLAVLPEMLESRLLMSVATDWAEPNNTQVTAWDLGALQGNVTLESLSIGQSSDRDWFQFTVSETGQLIVRLNDVSNSVEGQLIRGSDVSQAITLTANSSFFITAVAGTTYYLDLTSATASDYTVTLGAQGSGSTTFDEGQARPAQTQRAAFVTKLYQDTLGRNPEDGGLDFWVQGLASGTVTQGDVASAVINSTEYRTNLIQGLYQSILGREAETAGLNYWLDFFAAGHTVEEMKAQFYGSDEYFNNQGGSNEGLVDSFYVAFLNRHAEPAGLAYWLNQLNGGETRSEVAAGIQNLSQEGSETIVQSAYERLLGREPEPAGMEFWASQIRVGASVLDIEIGVLSSLEYYNNA